MTNRKEIDMNSCTEPRGNEEAYAQFFNSETTRNEPYIVTKHEAMIDQTGQCPWCGLGADEDFGAGADDALNPFDFRTRHP